MKQIRRNTGQSLSFAHLDNIFNEVQLLSKMENERIIKLFGKYRTEQFYNIIVEYCNGGDLRNFLRSFSLG